MVFTRVLSFILVRAYSHRSGWGLLCTDLQMLNSGSGLNIARIQRSTLHDLEVRYSSSEVRGHIGNGGVGLG